MRQLDASLKLGSLHTSSFQRCTQWRCRPIYADSLIFVLSKCSLWDWGDVKKRNYCLLLTLKQPVENSERKYKINTGSTINFNSATLNFEIIEKKKDFSVSTFAPREYFLWYFANYTWLSEINSNQVQFIPLEHLEACWLPSVCELSDRDGCAVHHPAPWFQVYRRRRAQVALLPSHLAVHHTLIAGSPGFPFTNPDNASRCLLSPLASNQRRCFLAVSPPLILLRTKKSAWKKKCSL